MRDVKHFSLDAEARPEMYVPQFDRPWPNMTLVLRADAGEAGDLVAAVRGEVTALDKSIPVANVKKLQQYVAASTGSRRFTMFLLGAFAAVALLLAGVGVYGVLTYSVAQRTREIGVRMALGAQPHHILRMVIRQGMAAALLGIALGLGAALLLTRILSSLLFGVSATDPLIFAATALFLAAVALLACYLPARRATKVEPLLALRHD